MDRDIGRAERMIIAGIDIGTNTVLLLVAEVDERGSISVLDHQQRLPRLGKDVDASGAIAAAAFDRIAWIVQEFKNRALQMKAERIVACATSAVRDASNRDEFCRYIQKSANLEVEVLSGTDEAALTYVGAVSGLTTPKHYAVLDVGGGSTELIYPEPGGRNGDSKLFTFSMQIGAVRLSERFFRNDPPLPEEIASAQMVITEELAQIRNPGFHETSLVGVAGSVTTIACLDQNLQEFSVEKVSGYQLSADRIAYWSSKLASLSTTEILALSPVTEGRADILTAGVLIVRQVMEHFRIPEIVVSERGLRFGIVLREWGKQGRSV